MPKAFRPPLDHLVTLSDDTGIIQHALFDVPNRSTGYCTDDVSRALMVVIGRLRAEPDNRTAHRLATIYLAFLQAAQMTDGWFHNFMGFERSWLDERGTQDAFGRAVWSLGYGARYAPRESWRNVCARLFGEAVPRLGELAHLRSTAYAILGVAHASESGHVPAEVCQPAMRRLSEELKAAYQRHRALDWLWFEDLMTYDNARLCEAALRAGDVLGDDQLAQIGLESFAFYRSIVLERDIFVPIGNQGWYPRGGKRAIYGQQPLEAAALIDAALAAYDRTGQATFLATAKAAWEWFYGRNTDRATLAEGGGCHDGIDAAGVNANMGAESTVAYLSAASALCEAENVLASNVDSQ